MNMKCFKSCIVKKMLLNLGVLIIILFLHQKSLIDLDFISQNHFNFITVSSVFAGFLFTSLGLIVGFHSNNSIKKFERIDTMDRIYSNILLGIIFSIISIAIAILCLIVNVNVPKLVREIVLCLEINFLILTVVQFVISVKCTYFAINVVRQDVKKNLPSKDSMNETIKKIK